MTAWRRCSIRTRLTVAASAVMALICAVGTLLALVSARGRDLEYQKAALVAWAMRVIERMVIEGPPDALPDGPGRAAQLFDPNRRLVAVSGNMAGRPPMANFGSGSATYQTRELCDLPDFPGQCRIVIDVPVHLANGTWRLYAAAPSPPWYGNPLLLALLVGGSVLLVAVTALGTYWAVSKTLEPVRAIGAKLDQITASDLGHRVPLPKYQDELEDLTRIANRTLDRAQAAVEQQLRFASDASHDLRSPLTAMRVRIEDALMCPEETDWPKTAAALLDSVERLQDLVTDLLQISRLDAGVGGRHEPVDLTALVASELDRRPRGVLVARDLAPQVTVDGDRIGLARLLINLLDNAERHADTTIAVVLRAEPGTAVLEVCDDGDGIPPEQRDSVFQRFVRLDASRQKDPGGTGLGLSIARQIAEKHGGTLTVEDSPCGARFVLRVPRRAPEPESALAGDEHGGREPAERSGDRGGERSPRSTG
ncbi:sensor histidine kinase [Microtetraspora fusca]|uniref:sensor histidine kinase n=1 Tax=Microtetraspora fusca TaxID=1997 RepID=UPI001FE18F9C|nr:HAMP domain-containing sensor histidine kinase [Microtetraspora fusca]